MMRLAIGVDTGGTFTDFVMLCPERGMETLKLSSTPDDPARAVLQGVAQLAGGAPPDQINHATTVATNALLERTGGRAVFITTRGFGDLLQLGRGQRRELYSLCPTRVEPPLSRDLCLEVDERVLADGSVRTALRESEVERLVSSLPGGLDAVALCLLHASVNPDHEEMLASRLSRHGVTVFASHRVAPGSGEYERGMTTLIAAYLSPKVERYLSRLERSLEGSLLRIVHSAGGLLTAPEARALPHRLALSGPAAGLRGALAVGERCGATDMVTLDMGGTSTDVALLAGGRLPYSWETTLEGYPLRAPTLDIHTVGAGGGSLAWADGTGLLRVGPRSAGATPGPACYGRGGTLPTVTDALCWNGFLPTTLGDERLTLQREAAGAALEGLGGELGLTREELSDGILQLAASHLAEAVRKVTTGGGYDPAAFTLFPFGGAGPLLACQVAENLSMTSILVPARAGVLSAWGALTAPWEREWSLPVPAPSRTVASQAEKLLDRLASEKAGEFEESEEIEWTRLVARRYRGQGETLVSAPGDDFHALHRERFGFARPEMEVETVEVRLRARRAPLESLRAAPRQPRGELLAQTEVRWRGDSVTLPVYRFEQAPTLTGPALLPQSGSTLFVAPGWRLRRLPDDHLLLERDR